VYWWHPASTTGEPGSSDQFFRAVQNMSAGVIPFLDNNFSCPLPCFHKYAPYAQLDCDKPSMMATSYRFLSAKNGNRLMRRSIQSSRENRYSGAQWLYNNFQ
jgi:hypothetical protein